MSVYGIKCGKCGGTTFKHVDGKDRCQDCGYALTNEDIERLLRQASENDLKTRKGKYVEYLGDQITKEVLNSIKVGDLVKVNDWKRPLRVRAVSEDYFVMAVRMLGKWDYSVCEKKPWCGTRHNAMTGGMFHVGTDAWIFGSPIWHEFGCKGYDFDNPEASQAYVNTFELPEGNREHAFISPRRAVPIRSLYIKS